MTTSHDTPLAGWEAVEADGIRLLHPPGWGSVVGQLGAVLAFRSPTPSPDEFHANVNVVKLESGGGKLEDLLAMQRQELEAFNEALLVDAQLTELGGRPATRVLVTSRSDDVELPLDQWMVPAGTSVVTVSATSATSNHADASEDLDAIVSTLEIHA